MRNGAILYMTEEALSEISFVELISKLSSDVPCNPEENLPSDLLNELSWPLFVVSADCFEVVRILRFCLVGTHRFFRTRAASNFCGPASQ
jgi:hypothetical protein